LKYQNSFSYFLSFRTLLVLNILFGGMLFLFTACNEDNPTKYDPPSDLPDYPLIDGYPSWSPDGTKIIYNHNGITRIDIGGSYHVDRDSSGLWMVNIDGSNPHLILRGDDINADWSLDGEWIVFEQGSQIYKVPVVDNSIDSSQIIQLTFQGSNFFPSWNPTGDWIAYDNTDCGSMNEPPPYNSCGILKIKGNGTNKQFLVRGRMPGWSQNGNSIIYIGLRNEIFKVNLNDTSQKTQLTRLNDLNPYANETYNPKYSPDDSKIIFESNANVWLMDNDGMNQKQLTYNGGLQPCWSYNGQKIVYIGSSNDNKYNPKEDGTVWIMNADGSNKQLLTFGPSP